MTDRRNAMTLLSLCVAMMLSHAVGCAQRAADKAAGSVERSRPRVAVVTVQRKTIRRVITQPAQIEAFEQARLYAKFPAYVDKYFVDIGDRVTGPEYDTDGKLTKHGQLLAQLSAPELEQELQQKKALLAQAGADVEQAQAAIKVAQAEAASAVARLDETAAAIDRMEAEHERWNSEYDRIVQLVAKNAVTQKLADETKSQLLSARAACKEAQARAKSAHSALATAKARIDQKLADEVAVRARRDVAEADRARTAALLDYLRIEAPFDGTISQRGAETGLFANAGGASDAQPLFTVVRNDLLRVFLDVPESDAPLVDVGDRATVRVQALSDRNFVGVIARTAWALDSTARTLRSEVDVPNEAGQLRPGMYAQVSLELAEAVDAIVAPQSCIFRQDGHAWCVVIKDGKAARTAVEVGIKSDGDVAIVSGLVAGEQVVQGKGASLTDGQEVEITQPTPVK